MPLPRSIREAMEGIAEAFQPERAASAIVQFRFSGAEPGNWVLQIAKGHCRTQEGVADNPVATIDAPSDIWLKICRRELDAATAFIGGHLTFRGEMGILVELSNWLGQR